MIFLIVFLNMIFASTFTLVKAALYYITPIFFIAIRMVIGGSLLLGYVYWIRTTSARIQRKHWWLFAQIILLHIYGAYVLEFIGIQYVTSAKSCLLYSLTPFMSVLFSYFEFNERMTRKKWAGLIIGFLGFVPILIASTPTEELLGSLGFISLPEMLILLSTCCAAQGWIAMRRLIREGGYSPIMINGIGMVFGGILAGITAVLFERRPFIGAYNVPQFPLDSWLSQWISSDMGMVIFYTVTLIIIANVISYNLYGYLLRRYSATFLAFSGFLCPLFAAFYGWWLLGESITGWFFVSLVIIALGLYTFYQDEAQVEA